MNIPLSFLTRGTALERAEGIKKEIGGSLNKIRREVGDLLRKELDHKTEEGFGGVMGRALTVLFDHGGDFDKAEDELLKKLEEEESNGDEIDPRLIDLLNYCEWAYKNIETVVGLDRSEWLSAVLTHKAPFGLYLRAYATEEFEPDLSRGAEDVSSIRLSRSIEVSNLVVVSESLLTFGLGNALDLNPLRKYQSVWLPPEFRDGWFDVVSELAKSASLIVVNATREGSGFRKELVDITQEFKDKVWLIAGRNADTQEFISQDVRKAAQLLGAARISASDISAAGITSDAWPRAPNWVKDWVNASDSRMKLERIGFHLRKLRWYYEPPVDSHEPRE